MLGGIFAQWKLPIMFMFDRAVNSDLLLSIISAAEAAGARVAAIVCDQGGSNRGLWKQLNVCHDGETCFSNPSDGRLVVTPFNIVSFRQHKLEDVCYASIVMW